MSKNLGLFTEEFCRMEDGTLRGPGDTWVSLDRGVLRNTHVGIRVQCAGFSAFECLELWIRVWGISARLWALSLNSYLCFAS